MKKNKLLPIWIALAAMLFTGCASTGRLDGGRSSNYGKDAETGLANGKKMEVLPINLLGSFFRLIPFTMESGLESTIDEPVVAVASSVASKTAAEKLSARSERDPGTGRKVVEYGAAGISTDAQKLDAILREIERIKNGIPHKVDRSGDDSSSDTSDDGSPSDAPSS